MQHVFFKCTYEIIAMPGFFTKLKAFIGEFRIEQQPIQDIVPGVVTISFSTDRVQIEEGKTRQVELIAENNEIGWDFTGINKFL
jgi:hypothetical protein